MSTELESTRKALREAVAQAEHAAELARLLDAAQSRLAEAERHAEEVKALAERLAGGRGRPGARARRRRQAPQGAGRAALPGRGGQLEAQVDQGRALEQARRRDQDRQEQPRPAGQGAQGRHQAGEAAHRPPKRKPVVVQRKDDRPGAAFQATTTTRTLAGESFKLRPFRVPTGPNTRPPTSPPR
ncbi:hypothetical protein ACFSTC_46725 [Nonomuraea ferruginea]